MKDLIKHLKFIIKSSNDCEIDNKIEQLIIDYIKQMKTEKQLSLVKVSKRYTENDIKDAYDKGLKDGYACMPSKM
jgi:uncharacterized pyridoxal phosphate-containing UPF0001 family protein